MNESEAPHVCVAQIEDEKDKTGGDSYAVGKLGGIWRIRCCCG